MAAFTQIIYHIVFSTKDRVPCLQESQREDLFRYIWGIVKNKRCYLYRINRVEDHLHLLTSIHPSTCLSDFIKDIKLGTSKWIKENRIFPSFSYWQEGYGAFTYSSKEMTHLVEYIKKQKEHHARISFRDELKALLMEHGIAFNENDLL